MRKQFHLVFVFVLSLASALVVSSGCRKGSHNPIAPTNGATAQIQRVDVSVPSGTVSQNGEGLDVTVTTWLSVDLPDSEYVSIHQCFSVERDKLTFRCANALALDVAALKRENPLQLRTHNSGYGGNSEPTTINYIHILVFRGLDLRRIDCGRDVSCPIPTDTIARETIEWTMTFM